MSYVIRVNRELRYPDNIRDYMTQKLRRLNINAELTDVDWDMIISFLPDRFRPVVELRFKEGMEMADVASMLNIRLEYAYARFRDAIHMIMILALK